MRLPGRSRTQGQRAVEGILALRKTMELNDENIRALESKLLTDIHEAFDTNDVPQQLANAQASRSRMLEALRRKHEALGVDERESLANATRSEYVRLRMNARALKRRIRDRLRQRKFELERLEYAYRQMVNGGSYVFSSSDVANPFFRGKSA